MNLPTYTFLTFPTNLSINSGVHFYVHPNCHDQVVCLKFIFICIWPSILPTTTSLAKRTIKKTSLMQVDVAKIERFINSIKQLTLFPPMEEEEGGKIPPARVFLISQELLSLLL